MPKITAPSAKDIETRPREYALLQQMADSHGSVDAKTLAEYQKNFGDATQTAGDSITFEQFAALFARESTKADSGEGNCIGYVANTVGAPFKPWRFVRRDPGEEDIQIQITHAGVCHSDIHHTRGEWGPQTQFPLVPGHEIAGIITKVGAKVKNFKVGDRAGVGCMVNACMECTACKAGEEQMCTGGIVFTYNSKDRDASMTRGGYSTHVVVDKKFVLKMPSNLALGDAVPLLCAGITVYSPIKYYGLDKKGMKVAVIGLGGLGHMAVKYLKAFGVHVTVISTSAGKKEEATKVLGADAFLVSSNPEEMTAQNGTFDGIIDTVSAKHDLVPGLSLLKAMGKYVVVGAPPEPPVVPTFMLISRKLMIGGSLIGGIKETQEMLDFSSKHNITCMIETIPIDQINVAYDRIVKADVRYRFVIDIQGSLIA